MIDPYGRIISSLPLDRMGVVDAALPRALTATLYARFADTIFAILLGSAAAAAFAMSRKESR